jgi:SAM-dependent methyltransferase
MPDRFFIKLGYQANASASWERSPGAYWNEDRLSMTMSYQFHVYERAAALFRSLGFRSLADVGCGPAQKTRHFFHPVAASVYLVDQPTVAPLAKRHYPEARFIASDLESQSFDLPEVVDMIVFADVVEHLERPCHALANIRKSLHPAHGRLVISTPERDIRRGRANLRSPNPQHVREWNAVEFAQYLEASGFCLEARFLEPPRRLSPFERMLRNCFGTLWRHPRWFACQTFVCQPRQ